MNSLLDYAKKLRALDTKNSSEMTSEEAKAKDPDLPVYKILTYYADGEANKVIKICD